jgi:glutathione S-transferase
MNEHLSARPYFVGGIITLADIALHAYTHVAEGGGFRLGDYPAVQAWLGRVAATPGFVPMDV